MSMVSFSFMEWKPFDTEKIEEARMIVNDIFLHVELTLKWENHKLVGAGEI